VTNLVNLDRDTHFQKNHLTFHVLPLRNPEGSDPRTPEEGRKTEENRGERKGKKGQKVERKKLLIRGKQLDPEELRGCSFV
jgi:diadenosine tetraphosphate (Ap4A) HIT family hydrolase